MRDSELIGLATREAERLTSENDHCAATLMMELVERLRDYAIQKSRGSTDLLIQSKLTAQQLADMIAEASKRYK